MCSDVVVRELRDADLPAVAVLLRTEWPDVDWEHRFARQWRNAPTVAGARPPRGFVHADRDAIRGFFGSIPIPYQVDGRAGLACIATALCVHPAARGHGVATALVAAFDTQRADAKVNSTPNAASAPLFARAGYASIDPAAGRHLLAHAEQPFGVLRKAWRAHKRGMVQSLLQVAPRAPEPALTCARLDAATAELDTLWQTHRGTHPTTLWRDRTTLQWLLFADPRCTVIGCRDGTGALRGYGACREERGELRQIDLFPACDDDVSFALGLASASLAAGRGIATVRLLSVSAPAARALQSHGFEPADDDLTIQVRGIDSHHAWLTRIDGDRWL